MKFCRFRKLFNANQAPKGDEEVTNRFKLFLDQKREAEERQKNRKAKVSKEDEELPHLKQKPNESDRNYIRRLNQV